MNQNAVIEMLDYLEEEVEVLTGTGNVRGVVAATASLVEKIYSRDHAYFLELRERLIVKTSYRDREYPDDSGERNRALKIIRAIRKEAESGLLFSNLRELVSAELFSNHLEMADHLLDNDYKDSAVVLIGSTLEIHLRELAESNSMIASLNFCKK